MELSFIITIAIIFICQIGANLKKPDSGYVDNNFRTEQELNNDKKIT